MLDSMYMLKTILWLILIIFIIYCKCGFWNLNEEKEE
jgi:hypothetical protein